MAKDDHDDAVAQVAQADTQDATIQRSRKAGKKSAFMKSANERLGKLSTDLDVKVNREIAKLNKIEPTDQEILDVAKAYEEHKEKQTKNEMFKRADLHHQLLHLGKEMFKRADY